MTYIKVQKPWRCFLHTHTWLLSTSNSVSVSISDRKAGRVPVSCSHTSSCENTQPHCLNPSAKFCLPAHEHQWHIPDCRISRVHSIQESILSGRAEWCPSCFHHPTVKLAMCADVNRNRRRGTGLLITQNKDKYKSTQG